LPKHGASKHHCLLLKRPVFLLELILNWSVGVEYDHLFMGNNNNFDNSLLVVTPVIAGVSRINEDFQPDF
jgi:hypothetical protein